MNWLNRLERKFGRYAITNLPLYIVVLYAIGAAFDILSGGVVYYQYLALNPFLILHGQIWRLVTFLVATPSTSIIFLVFVLLFYYSIGQSLTQVWGAFKFNMYVLVGILGTIAAAFIVYALTRNPLLFMDTSYVNLSMFLAYAAIFPEMRVYIYGIIPIKVKWLAILDVVVLAIGFVQGDMGTRISVVVGLLNFLLFYFSTRCPRRRCTERSGIRDRYPGIPAEQDMSARSATGRNWTIRIWSSVTVPNVTAIMSTAMSIFLRIPTSNDAG